MSGRSLYLLWALLPFFVFPFISMFTDIELFDLLPIDNRFLIMSIGYLFILAVFFGALGFSKFAKDNDL
ncbi:hypothetical protein [Thalassotalea sp. G2M2-11]|uniref:hypothetical protein n=1 Tax=Thalassotalea sp. G2M2-11 TaxID=2787627 RepID=UPI0019D2D16F|nr:hypothetical protein [Thalassotalea sp. G2M2-11]